MATKAKQNNANSTIIAMRELGETYGASNKAQLDAYKLFSNLANTGGFEATDDATLAAKAMEYTRHFYTGVAKKTGESVPSDESLKVYASQMKTFAAKRVWERLDKLESEAAAFIAATPSKERGGKKLFELVKSAASRVRKAKEETDIPEINPGLFQSICAPKAATPPKPADAKKAATTAFKSAAVALQECGLADGIMTHLVAIATALDVDIAVAKTETPAPTATPSVADLMAMMQALIAKQSA